MKLPVTEKLKKLHRCLYILIRQKWAVSENIEIFVKLSQIFNLQSCQNLDDNENKVTYMSLKIVSQMIEIFGEVLWKTKNCTANWRKHR